MKAATEFVGTFLFLFVIALVAPIGAPVAPIVIGLALAALVYMGGHRSGAHYNPAVSLALWLRKKITAAELGAYVVAQLVAGVLAFALAKAIAGEAPMVAPPSASGPGSGPGIAFAVEAIFTAMLVLVILNVAASKRTEGNSFYGLAIGLTIVAAATAGGPISGGSFNPAVAIASAVLSGTAATLWITAVGPIVGAVAASYFWAWQESSDRDPIVGPAGKAIDQPATGHPIRE